MDLASCPFCGEQHNLSVWVDGTRSDIRVQCNVCRATGPCADHMDRDQAIAHWNRRPTSTLPDACPIGNFDEMDGKWNGEGDLRTTWWNRGVVDGLRTARRVAEENGDKATGAAIEKSIEHHAAVLARSLASTGDGPPDDLAAARGAPRACEHDKGWKIAFGDTAEGSVERSREFCRECGMYKDAAAPPATKLCPSCGHLHMVGPSGRTVCGDGAGRCLCAPESTRLIHFTDGSPPEMGAVAAHLAIPVAMTGLDDLPDCTADVHQPYCRHFKAPADDLAAARERRDLAGLPSLDTHADPDGLSMDFDLGGEPKKR